MTPQTIPLTNFESIKNNLTNSKHRPDNNQNNVNAIDIFYGLLEENDNLSIHADDIISDIDSIVNTKDSVSKNITFKSIINTLKLAVKEYMYQKILFETYIQNYTEMCNEENVVKILELIRQVIADRRVILNDITNNLLKLQKLDNERIKIDAASGDDIDDIDDIVSPDTF